MQFCKTINLKFAPMEKAPIATVFRKESFNAAHRLHNPDWDTATNQKVFGKCNNPNYHGHNYRLIVGVKGEIDPGTGYVIDMKVLSALIENEIIERYDHRNLNLDVPEFKDTNPSAENIAIEIWKRLHNKLPAKFQISVRLYETDHNYVEYTGPVND